MLIVDEVAAAEASRPLAISLALFTMRSMEHWKHDVDDYDRAMILVAIVAITSERFLRTELGPDERKLSTPFAPSRLAPCNISSIASATGLNRETTRRKVQSLVEQGILVRDAKGIISFVPGILQQDSTFQIIRRQLDGAARLANDLIKLGVLKPART